MMIGLMMTRKRNSTTQQREEKTNKARDLKLENYDERFMTFRTEGFFVFLPRKYPQGCVASCAAVERGIRAT